MLSVAINIVMLNIVTYAEYLLCYAESHLSRQLLLYCYAESRYFEYRYTECRYVECRYAKSHGTLHV